MAGKDAYLDPGCEVSGVFHNGERSRSVKEARSGCQSIDWVRIITQNDIALEVERIVDPVPNRDREKRMIQVGWARLLCGKGRSWSCGLRRCWCRRQLGMILKRYESEMHNLVRENTLATGYQWRERESGRQFSSTASVAVE